jgi:hypothetical protein
MIFDMSPARLAGDGRVVLWEAEGVAEGGIEGRGGRE